MRLNDNNNSCMILDAIAPDDVTGTAMVHVRGVSGRSRAVVSLSPVVWLLPVVPRAVPPCSSCPSLINK